MKKITFFIIASLFTYIISLLPFTLLAWENSFSLGPGTGIFLDGKTEICPFFEITYGRVLYNPENTLFMRLPDVDFSFWLTLGSRVTFTTEKNLKYIPYIETGIWYFLTYGIGYSVIFDKNDKKNFLNLFLGLPIPIIFSKKMFYWEPYFKPYFNCNSFKNDVKYEVGLLIKYVI